MPTPFEKDLEFVQLLCNPEYLKWLYSEKHFEKESFRKYLKYLEYFKRPEYSKFVIYPQCIAILEILTHERADEFLSNDQFYAKLEEGQHLMWRFRS